MKEKVALVTGSSRGIGRDVALRLAEKMAAVAVHFFQSQEKAAEVVDAVKKTQTASKAFKADLTDAADANKLITGVTEEFGRIDIMVNNVGPIFVKPWDLVKPEEWETALRSNLLSAVYCMQAVLPGMRQRGWGRIINLGYSRAEQLTALPSITPYAVAKTGLLILTRTAAKTEAPAGITVNMVSPGLIEGGIFPADKDVPIGRLGKFAEVAHAVDFLISSKADYITGTNLVVAGGWKL